MRNLRTRLGLGGLRQQAAGAAAPNANWAFSGIVTDTSFATVETFAGFAIGDAAANRLVVAVIYSSASINRTLSGVTIGGVTATEALFVDNANLHLHVYFAIVPTGTTAAVVITHSSAPSGAGGGVAVWYGLPSAAVVVDAVGTLGSSVLTKTAADCEVSIGGLLICVGLTATSSNLPATGAWNGADSLTENFNGASASRSLILQSGSVTEDAAGGDFVFTVNASATYISAAAVCFAV